MSEQSDLIELIDQEYDRSEGFLGRLRAGDFDARGAARLLDHLRALDLGDGPVDRRLVQLLWYMPMFLQWQKERFALDGHDTGAISSTQNQVVSILEGVLGAP